MEQNVALLLEVNHECEGARFLRVGILAYEFENSVYAVVYGYSGGGCQSDFSFKLQSTDDGLAIFRGYAFSDDQWEYRAQEVDDKLEMLDPPQAWSETDEQAFRVLYNAFKGVFFHDGDYDYIQIKRDAIEKYGLVERNFYCSDNFDIDWCYYMTPHWDLSTGWRD